MHIHLQQLLLFQDCMYVYLHSRSALRNKLLETLLVIKLDILKNAVDLQQTNWQDLINKKMARQITSFIDIYYHQVRASAHSEKMVHTTLHSV